MCTLARRLDSDCITIVYFYHKICKMLNTSETCIEVHSCAVGQVQNQIYDTVGTG